MALAFPVPEGVLPNYKDLTSSWSVGQCIVWLIHCTEEIIWTCPHIGDKWVRLEIHRMEN